MPGGSVTYTVDVRGIRPGDGAVTTEMRSDSVLGATIVDSHVTVRRR